MIVQPIKTRIFKEGESVDDFICGYFKEIPEKSVLVVTSKIVALSEGRTAGIRNKMAKEKIIKSESSFAMKTKHVWLTLKDGMIMANAGADESNANGRLILLPKNSFKSAEIIRKSLRKKFHVKNLGVLITDSRTLPLRAGVIGVALGYAGFKGLKDYRGSRDIFGRKFIYSRANVADGLSAAAVLAMGEGKERQPLALIQNPPVEFSEKARFSEPMISIKDDMYQPLFSKLLEK